MSRMLNGAIRFRALRPELEPRWVGVSYVDLVEDPMAVVNDICERLNRRFEPDARESMEDWLSRQAEQRRREPRHRYSLEVFGLTRERVDAAFTPYRDFIAARGIR